MLNYKLSTLKNGLRLITAPITTSEAVTILILVKTGGRYEKSEVSGISHFIEHMFFKGSKKYPDALKIAKELDSLGGRYNAFTSEEYTGFYIQSDANDFTASFDLLSDMFLNPLFPETEFEKEKGVVIEEAKYRRDIPQWHVQVLSQKLMFGSHPLGLSLSGTPETVGKITREDLVNYFLTGYTPSSTVVAICGNPKNNDWDKAVNERFKSFKPKLAPKYEIFKEKPIREKIVKAKKAVDQTHLVLAASSYRRNNPQRYALSILMSVLGGGMSSRLFTEVRENRGWAYDIRSENYSFEDTGIVGITAGIKRDKLIDSVKIILEEIRKIQEKGITKEELDRAKRSLRANLAISLEDSFEIASYLADELLNEKKIREPEEILASWDKVTGDEVKKCSQEIFQSAKMGLAYVGAIDQDKELKKLIEDF